jgi:hypothetical protein
MNRILIVGWGRAGKDCAAEYLGKISTIPYAGSTSWAAKGLVAAVLGLHPQVAWETRHQRRMEWKQICDDLRFHDPCRLIRLALWDHPLGHGIVAGCRDKIELDASRRHQVFDRILWIDRLNTPKDPTVTFGPEDCDEIIYNNGTLEAFYLTLSQWADRNGILRVPSTPTIDKIRE